MIEMLYRKMQHHEFDCWSAISIKDYAEDLAQNHRYNAEQAESSARDSFAEMLPDGINTIGNHFRVLDKGGKSTGFLWYKLENNTAFLYDIMICPGFKSQGLGRRLMNALLTELKEESVSEVELRVSPSNFVAINLYQDLGFRITGHDMSLILK